MTAVGTPSRSAPLLQVEGLRAHFFNRAGVVKALDDVSFTVRKGEALAVVGEAGSGKSMIARSVMGLVEPPAQIVSGRILFENRDLVSQSTEAMRKVRGRRIAMIFRDPTTTLDPMLRIEAQMVEAVLAHDPVSREIARQRARAAVERAGIPAPDKRLVAYPGELSHETCQRLAIAMALIHDPALLISEEPAATLDFPLRDLIFDEVQARARETGAAVLWITRDLSVAAAIAERVCVMYAGRIVEEGSSADVLRQPAHPYTRGLLEALPSRAARGSRLRAMPGMMPSLGALPSGCAFRERCANAIDACVAAPEVLPFGLPGSGRAVRCHNPVAISVPVR